MTRHLVYLIRCSVRNAGARQLRRLRSPRYAIAAILGLLYFVVIFGGWLGGAEGAARTSETWLQAARHAGPLALALFTAIWWLWGGYTHGLVLTPAETSLLVPAPITRRQIIQYKVIAAQPAILFGAAVATLLTRSAGLPAPLRLISLHVLFATLHQHQIAASLVHAAAGRQGRSGLRRQWLPITLFTAAFGVLGWSLIRAVVDMRAAGTLAFVPGRLVALLDETGPRIVLAPFRALVAPAVANGTAAWLPAFGIALVLLVLHYLWLIRTDAAFEEAAAEQGARRAEQLAALRKGGISRLRFTGSGRVRRPSQPLLPLRPRGHGAYALFWKNVLYMQRLLRPATLAVAIGALAVFVVISGVSGVDAVRAIALLLVSLAGLATLMGPLAVRNDLRMDLAFADLLRTWPLRGRDIVAAEVAASTTSVSVPQLVVMLTGLALLAGTGLLAIGQALLLALASIIALPVINALALLIQNGIALLYPEWSRIGQSHGGGMEAVGQNVLTLIATTVALLVCAIPPILAGALVGGPLMLASVPLGIAGAAIAVLATLLGEIALMVRWLGRAW